MYFEGLIICPDKAVHNLLIAGMDNLLSYKKERKVENRQVKKLRKDAYRNRRKSVLDDDQKKWFFTRQAYDYTCGHVGSNMINIMFTTKKMFIYDAYSKTVL